MRYEHCLVANILLGLTVPKSNFPVLRLTSYIYKKLIEIPYTAFKINMEEKYGKKINTNRNRKIRICAF